MYEENLYIRFGEIPQNGKSAIWHNNECVGYEDGIDCFYDDSKVDDFINAALKRINR